MAVGLSARRAYGVVLHATEYLSTVCALTREGRLIVIVIKILRASNHEPARLLKLLTREYLAVWRFWYH